MVATKRLQAFGALLIATKSFSDRSKKTEDILDGSAGPLDKTIEAMMMPAGSLSNNSIMP